MAYLYILPAYLVFALFLLIPLGRAVVLSLYDWNGLSVAEWVGFDNYRQVVAELRKVVYPTQEQLVTYFIVVMVFVLVMMAIVAGLDLAFGKLAFEIFDGKSSG